MTDTRKIQVLLADRFPSVRAGLASWFEAAGDIEVRGQADNVRDTLQLVKTLEPDVVILEISLENGDCLELAKSIHKTTHSKTIFYTAFDESIYGERCLAVGAMGFVNKQADLALISRAVREVAAGKLYFSAELLERRNQNELPTDPIASLTDRQLEIFRLIGEGKSTTEIAAFLHLSTHTIETHRENLKHRLGIPTGGELVRCAILWVHRSGKCLSDEHLGGFPDRLHGGYH